LSPWHAAEPEDFQRFDETPDTDFYSYPRFVTHIDDNAIAALTDFYARHFPQSGSKDVAVLGESNGFKAM
jgi:hypothetical protein